MLYNYNKCPRSETISKDFIKFYNRFLRSDIERAIELYSIVGGAEELLHLQASTQEHILSILRNYKEIQRRFDLVHDEILLSTFATGDRKIESAIKKSFFKESQGYDALQNLIDKNMVYKELSREKLPPKTHPKQKRKKELRRYRIQNKIRFAKPFVRFWYRYIYPSLELLESGQVEKVASFIMSDLDNFVSLTFEELSNALLKERFPQAISSGSYWDRRIELDILLELPDGETVVGECKWKNSKICKKTLTSLQKKASISGFRPRYFALFSKSGFSHELLKQRREDLLLFDLEDFKEWSEQSTYRKRSKEPYSFEF